MTSNRALEPRIPIQWHVPGVAAIQAEQAGSSWPTIPWRSPSSWNGWVQRQLGLEYAPAVSTSGPAKWVRYEWRELPQRHKDDFYMVGGATYNGIVLHSTFATPAVMQGFKRAVKATCKVSL